MYPTQAQTYLKSVYKMKMDTNVHSLLTYLCMIGDYEETKKVLLESIGEDPLGDGTLLHTALYWNCGDMGYKFFNLFYTCNAKICKNSLGEFPWEQKGDSWSFICPENGRIVFGERRIEDFEILYHYIPLKIKRTEEEFGSFLSNLFKKV